MKSWALTAAFYGFFFGAMGAHLPFWPVWLKDWGLTEAEVGDFLALAVVARVLCGLAAPWLADRLNAPRRALAALGALGTVLFLAHPWIDSRAVLLAATLATAGVIAGITPIADALSLRAAGRGGYSYGPVRSVGSATFLLVSLACGATVGLWGSGVALWWIVAGFAPLAVLGLIHPGGAGAPVGRPRLAEAARLARSPVFLTAMVAGAAAQSSHAVLYAYGSIHWRAQGIGDGTIGALWAFGVVVEVAVMALWGRRLIEALGPVGAMALACAAGLIRWTAMLFDPGLAWLWPLQALHGLTFTAAHLGVIAFVRAAAPDRLAATAQGLTGAVAGGAMMAGASFLAARVYPHEGAGAFWIAIGLAALGLAAALLLRRIWRGGELDLTA